MNIANEELLADNGVTRVVKVGLTVRRPIRPFTSSVQAFLAHLWNRGVRCIPQPLGTDADGREVLSYVPGEVPVEPLPDWAASDHVLAALGQMIRSLHDAAQGWEPPLDATWGGIPGSNTSNALNDPALELIAHHDYCPGNVVFRNGMPAALIDFDLARPTTRVSDCANALYWWAPLLDPLDRAAALVDADIPSRCRVFADSYAMSRSDRKELATVALARSQGSLVAMRTAADLDPVFRRWWEEGVGDRLHRARDWMALNAEVIEARLLS